MIDVRDVWLDLDFGVDLAQMISGGDGLRQTILGVAFGEHRLSLKIRWLDEVAIDKTQVADAGAAQTFGLRRSQCTAADDKDARRLQAPLPFFAYSIEQNLSTIAVVHCVFSIAVNDRITRSARALRLAAGKSG